MESNDKEKPPLAWVMFGSASHEGEYVLSLENFNARNYIPEEIITELREKLGDEWRVDNRGSRIEIYNKQLGVRDDDKVHVAIRSVLSPRGYELEE